ncbi:hypothetical protein, partial [Dietzia lutea]
MSSADPQRHHRQWKGDDDLAGGDVGQQELVVGDGAVELASAERGRKAHGLPVVVDLPVRCGYLNDRLVRGLLHSLVALGVHREGLRTWARKAQSEGQGASSASADRDARLAQLE